MPDQTEHINQTIGNDNVFCTHCGTENAKDSYSCIRCGERLVEITTVTTSPMGLVSCARCGGANNTRAVHCWVCGTEMNDAIRISPAPQAEPRRAAQNYQPDINPISVPAPAGEPKDERADLRGPAPGSVSGQGPGASAGSAPVANGSSTAEELGANTSGVKDAEVPQPMRRWNWAAFLLPDIWGVFNGVPWTLALIVLAYLPFPPFEFRLVLIIVVRIFLGLRGNQLAWRGKKWRSETHFLAVQRRWVNVSVIVMAIFLIVILASPEVFLGSQQEP